VTVVQGHPYLTRELAAKRAEQRRILRSFPDWIVANVRLNRPGPRLPDPDGALVERELRRLADRELRALRDWLPSWRTHAEAELLERWFERAEIGATLDGVAEAVRDAYETSRVVDYPPGLFPVMLRVVALLAWADLQAGEYSDPRLRRYDKAWRSAPPMRAARRRPPPGPLDEAAFWDDAPRRRPRPSPGGQRRSSRARSGPRLPRTYR
jgi:hypothetical protein